MDNVEKLAECQKEVLNHLLGGGRSEDVFSDLAKKYPHNVVRLAIYQAEIECKELHKNIIPVEEQRKLTAEMNKRLSKKSDLFAVKVRGGASVLFENEDIIKAWKKDYDSAFSVFYLTNMEDLEIFEKYLKKNNYEYSKEG